MYTMKIREELSRISSGLKDVYKLAINSKTTALLDHNCNINHTVFNFVLTRYMLYLYISINLDNVGLIHTYY